MPPPLNSVRDIADFPFETFEEFQASHREGGVQVRVRYEPISVWRHSSPVERVMQAALSGSAVLASLVFALLALYYHDNWLLLAIPASFLAMAASSASPGVFTGGGCMAILLFTAGFIGSFFVDRRLFWVGVCGFACWFLSSAGKGVADVTVREAIMLSEKIFLDLYRRGAITQVLPTDLLPAAEGVASSNHE